MAAQRSCLRLLLCFLAGMKAGDEVSVYSDIEGKCKRGAVEFDGIKVFIGNGIAEVSRSDIFCTDTPRR